MLLPFMADGIAMYRLECKADVIAFVVDGITNKQNKQEEAMSVGLAKACVPRKKFILFKRN